MVKFDKFIFLSATMLIAGFAFLNFPMTAHAMTPILSLSTSGQTGDYVLVNVTGDPNASVFLYFSSQEPLIGNINSNGNASIPISSATYGLVPNTTVYVKTGGLNGLQSNGALWPYVSGSSTTGNLTLSPTALLLNVGQTSTVTASSSSLWMPTLQTNPSIANINLNGQTITVQALTYGSTTANICIVGGTTNCANLAITVQSSGAQQLNFSQNNFSIVSGQNIPVTITGGSGNYTVSNNSNPSSVQTGLNGSVVTLTATGTSGSSSVTVCTTDGVDCGIIIVNATALNSNAITFSQSNPVVPFGQSTTVTIFGGTGTNFYVSSNSNPSIVQANISSNILTLIGNASSGTSAITICAVAGTCGSITANVSSISTTGTIMLSQSTVSILAGQSSTITISGGSTPYSISSTSSTNIFSTNISGNILTVYGVNSGSATASVCSSTGCTNLYITINSINSSTAAPILSQNNILTNVGQQTTVSISGNGVASGSYYISANSSPSVASANISGSSLVISATQSGTDNISVCQTGGQCVNFYATVSGTTAQLVLSQTDISLAVGQNMIVSISGNGGYYISTNSASGVASSAISGSSLNISALTVGTDNISVCQTGGQCANLYVTVSNSSTQTPATAPTAISTYVFPRYLGFGDKGDDVLQLQKLLSSEGFLSAAPNGHYGSATKLAVQKFQNVHSIKQTGNVGVATLATLNQISASTSTSASTATSTKAQQISTIQAAIQQLLAQVSQIQGQ